MIGILLSPQQVVVGVVCLLLGGFFLSIIWAWSHREKDDAEDVKRKRLVNEIEEELDRIKKQ